MNIILGKHNADQLDDKFVVLELDTFIVNGDYIPSYAVIEAGEIPLAEISTLDRYKENHAEFITEYRKQNWSFCEQMIEHLSPRWGGTMMSFYGEMLLRINDLKDKDASEDWDYAIQR